MFTSAFSRFYLSRILGGQLTISGAGVINNNNRQSFYTDGGVLSLQQQSAVANAYY